MFGPTPLFRAVRLTAIVALVPTLPLAAQTVEGRVVDADRGTPIPSASVAAIQDGRTLAGALTDEGGSFRVNLPRGGAYTLRVTNQGYSPRTTDPVRVERRDRVAVGEVRLQPNPVALDAIVVAVDPGSLAGQQKVQRRQRLGQGTFFSGAELVQQAPRSLTAYLAEKADLQVRYDIWGFPYLWSPVGPYHCLVVQVNHWPLSTLGYRSLDEIRLSRVAAIEIYNTVSEVPPEEELIRYTREPRLHPGQKCGLVNVWFWRAW